MYTFSNAKNITITTESQKIVVEFAETFVIKKREQFTEPKNVNSLPCDMFRKYHNTKDDSSCDESEEVPVEEPEFHIDMVMPPRIIEAPMVQDNQLKVELDKELEAIELKRRIFLDHEPREAYVNIFIINLPSSVTCDDIHLLCKDFEKRLDIRLIEYTDSTTALIFRIERAWMYILNSYMFRGRILETKIAQGLRKCGELGKNITRC